MSDPLPVLKKRNRESHKGDFGRALLIGGSRGMSGAIGLAGLATLRSGAGLVKLAVPDQCLETVAAFEPSLMTAPLPCDAAGRVQLSAKQQLAELLPGVNCVACGPGLGRSDDLTALVAWLYETTSQSLVVDADGLNAIAARREVLARRAGPRILTPHPGEFRRLINNDATGDDAAELAIRFAGEHGVVLVLKGHRSLITDGERVVRNSTGNPGMATGGSGDVLTGIITALVCQGLSPFDAAHLGCHLHGLAGDLAATRFGEVSLIASDLIQFLPQAFMKS